MNDLHEKLINAIEERKDELFNILSKLIQTNSENFGSYGNELECAQYILKLFQDMGVQADLYSPDSVEGMTSHPDYLPGRSLHNRPNVTAWIPGNYLAAGQSKEPKRKLMLAAHSDTMPVGDESKWSVPPLGGIIRDGRIWGRGACDDKYGIAVAIFLMRLLKDLGIILDYDLFFTAYSDEEHGGGNGALASCLKYPCDDYLNMDCKKFEIWNCAIGGQVVKATVRSKTPVDSCAVVADGLFLVKEEFFKFKERRLQEISADPHYTGTVIPDTSMRIMEFTAGKAGNDLDVGYINVVFYTTKTEKEIQEEFKLMKEVLKPKLDALGLELVEIKPTTRFFHYAPSQDNNPVIKLLNEVSEKIGNGPLTVCGSCLSDLSLFIKYGSPRAISFGIGRDFDEYGGAHQTDEFIDCDELVRLAKIVGVFLLEY
ncbi:MAG TPA: M20 family metallopeptidase [Clostridiaceae bacterium]|nr:M20 family metallopeptidase [Clostridiaceae bacterium]